MQIEHTQRGFAIAHFKDRGHYACSIQDSSIMGTPSIWLGVDEPNPKRMFPGEGWMPITLPPEITCTTRMHLTQEQAAALLPLLQQFVKTGSISNL